MNIENFRIQHEGKHCGKPSLFVNLNLVKDVTQFIFEKLKTPFNETSLFLHPKTLEDINLVFTGPNSFSLEHQKTIIDVVENLSIQNNTPKYITIETDGSQPPCQQFIEYFNGKVIDWSDNIKKRIELTWSIIVDHVVDLNFTTLAKLNSLNENGQILIMCDGTNWAEIENTVKKIKQELLWEVWIIPLTAKIYTDATIRGYKVSVNNRSVI